MKLARTTVRLQEDILLRVKYIALEERKSFQDILSKALEDYIQKRAKKKTKKIRFIRHDLGEPLDNLTRDAYYD